MERLLVERSITLSCSLDCSTQLVYSSALNSYLTFCQLHHLDPKPTTNTLTLYNNPVPVTLCEGGPDSVTVGGGVEKVPIASSLFQAS